VVAGAHGLAAVLLLGHGPVRGPAIEVG